MTEPLKIIGNKKGTRIDAYAKVRGRALYADDIRMKGMLYGRLVRSTYAHARIKSINTSKAEAIEGVHAVLTGADFPVKFGILPVHQDETGLAVDKVRFIGEPVAAVCAETEDIAQAAVKAIEVEYDPLDTIFSVFDAHEKSERLHESEKFEGNAHRVVALEFGDVEQVFAGAEYVREDMCYFSGNTHVPMETHSTVADFDGKRLTLHVSHQAPYYLQKILPKVLGLPSQGLRVVVPYVGGGFGGKLDPFSDTICAGKFSMVLGRPVKMTLSREEVFYNHRGRHPSLMWIKTAMNGDRIMATHFKAFLDGGAYGSFGTAAAYYHGALQPTTYRFPNYKAEIVRFYTNKAPCGPKRGHGTPQPRFALETHLDKIAQDLKISPIALRRANLTKPHSITTNHLRITSSALDECIEKVAIGSDFDGRQGKMPEGEGLGIAIGCYISGAALPIYWNKMPHSEVLIKADRSGTITAYSGHTEIGQGADTVLAYIVAEVLGTSPDDIALVVRDSDAVPPDLGSYSSRVTMMMGNAAKQAAEKLRDALAAAVADHLELSVDDVRFADRRVGITSDPDRSLTIEDAIGQAEARVGALSFSGSFTPSPEYGDFKGAGVGPSPAYSFAACVVHVVVDPVTGIPTPKKVWIAHDIGRCISRKNVEGQIEGGIYMGLGEAQMEEMGYTREGLLKNVSLLDYKMPTIMETPELEMYIVESVDEKGPFGAKEAGQGPLLPVIPAFVNAVHDAIGIRFDEIPVTPDKVLRALNRGDKRVGPRKIVDFVFPEPVRTEVPSDASS